MEMQISSDKRIKTGLFGEGHLGESYNTRTAWQGFYLQVMSAAHGAAGIPDKAEDG